MTIKAGDKITFFTSKKRGSGIQFTSHEGEALEVNGDRILAKAGKVRGWTKAKNCRLVGEQTALTELTLELANGEAK